MKNSIHRLLTIFAALCLAAFTPGWGAGVPIAETDSFNPAITGGVIAVAQQPDGKILIAGNFTALNSGAVSRTSLARVDAAGVADTSFNANITSGTVSSIAVQPDGKILITGTNVIIGGAARPLTRLNSDGSLDSTFSTPGLAAATRLLLQPDGKILLAATSGSTGVYPSLSVANVGRMNADGTRDTSFTPDSSDFFRSIALQQDGKIVYVLTGAAGIPFIGRLNADGSVDTAFKANLPALVVGTIGGIAIQSDGRIVVTAGRDFTSIGGKISTNRLNSNGTLDTTWDGPTLFTRPNNTFAGSACFLVPQADGKLIVGGNFGSATYIGATRLNVGGSLDTTFAPAFLTSTSADAPLTSAFIQADGKVIAAGGTVATVNGVARSQIARLTNDAATQTLSATASTVTWARGGSAPDAYAVYFEKSTDGGATWTRLTPDATRVVGSTGNWELTGQALSGSGQVRATAFLRTATGNNLGMGTSLAQQTASFTAGSPATVTAISPTTGTTAGGTSVTITGTNFTGATAVTIGGVAAPITSVAATTIVATTGAHAAGAVDVVVTTPGGPGTGTGLFTYVAPPANTAPTDITLSNASIAENNAPGATIGTLTATDADAGDTHTFELASIASLGAGGNDNAAFTITGNTLTINASADFETKSSYNIRIRATDSGAGNLFFEKSFTITITDVTIPQTITFAPLGGKTFGDAAFTVSATGGASGQPVVITRINHPSVADIAGNTVTINGAGLATFRASQAGSGDYGAATPVDQSFTIAKAAQTITFNPATTALTTDTVVLSATGGGSGNAVTFSVFSGPGSLAGNSLTFTGTGAVVVRASQAGTNPGPGDNYLAATPVDATITVSAAGLSTIVTNTNDSGAGSLRQAVLNANANPGADAITFDPTVFATAQTIVVNALPPTYVMLALTGDTTVTGPTAGVTVEAGRDANELFNVGTGSTVSITGLTIIPSADTQTNCIVNRGTLTVSNCVWRSSPNTPFLNVSTGIVNNHIATVTGCTFGGAGVQHPLIVFQNGGSLTVSDSLFLNCDQGVINFATATLSGCTISNEANGLYGPMRNYSGTLTLTNCSIIEKGGDGLFIIDDGALLFQNCTLAENSVFPSQVLGGTVTMKNTIYRRNPASAATTDGGGNLVLNRTGTDAAALAADLTTLGLDPTGLQDNGGPTPTIALLSGAAINGGLAANIPVGLTTDQRGSGFPRTVGTVDIGAFEAPAAPTVTTPTATGITSTSATLGGNVTSDGGSAILDRGIVYSKTADNAAPSIEAPGTAGVSLTGTTGVFTTEITGLMPNTAYSYVAYALNSEGVAYTSVGTFTTSAGGGLPAVDDAVASTTGTSVLYPLANDGNPAATIVSVSETSVVIDGRTLIVPAGYTGTFTYTTSEGQSATVTVVAATVNVIPQRFSGLLYNSTGAIVGRATTIRSTGGVNTFRVQIGSGLGNSVFTFPSSGNSATGIRTQLGTLTAALGENGHLAVTMSGGISGELRPSALSPAFKVYNVKLNALAPAVRGTGFGTVRITAAGAGKILVKMPDGRAFSAATEMADNGSMTFYGRQAGTNPFGYAGGELVLADLAKTDLTGELEWKRPAQSLGVDRAPVNSIVVANGCVANGTLGIPNGPATLTFSGGNFAAPAMHAVTVSGGAVVPFLPTVRAWTVQPASQTFKVVFRQPGRAVESTGTGMYFQKTQTAAGFFSGNTLGGTVELKQP